LLTSPEIFKGIILDFRAKEKELRGHPIKGPPIIKIRRQANIPRRLATHSGQAFDVSPAKSMDETRRKSLIGNMLTLLSRDVRALARSPKKEA
jgi:hypothetical protein